MQKLKAFTLMELLIGMIISSLVIGFGYATYTLIYKQYQSYRMVKNELQETAQLNTTLANDMHQADLVFFTDHTLVLHQKNGLPLNYVFNELMILRNENDRTDTFKLAATAVTPTFIFQSKRLIKKLSFTAKVLGDTSRFVFSKRHSSESLINYEEKIQLNP